VKQKAKAMTMKSILPMLVTLAFGATILSAQTITNQPASQALWAGGNVTFTVGVSGAGPFTYQWQFNTVNLPNGIITTVAGGGSGGDGGPATNANVNPYGVAVDASGNLFIADTGDQRIRKVSTNGIITTVAGNGAGSYSGDGGPATNASLNAPYGVAVDASGNLFIADNLNSCIRKVSTNGIITTVAGNGTWGYSGDGGPATNAQLHFPDGVAVDASGNLFIADSGNQRIRRVDTNGIITTVAGNGSGGYSGDSGAATKASLHAPYHMAVDASGNLFIADLYNSRVRKVSTSGIITTVAGNGTWGYSGDGGAATNASLADPVGVAVDASGNLFIADYTKGRIRMVSTDGIITTVAGNGSASYSGDGGKAISASLYYPHDVAVDASDNLFIADTYNNRIRKVIPNQGPTLALNNVTAANAGNYQVVVTGSGGSVTSSVVTLIVATITNQPASRANVVGTMATFSVGVGGVTSSSYQWLKNGAVMTNGGNISGSTAATLILNNVQHADAASYAVVVTNVAGSVTSSPAMLTVVDWPIIISTQPASQALWAGGHVTFAVGVSGVGPFTYQWQFNNTNLPNNIITTVVGNGTAGYSGDGGPATDASLNGPFGVALDASNNLFIADNNNLVIREVSTTGIITTVAGNGTEGHSGNGGAATNATLEPPTGVAVDATGNLFIADYWNNWVRKVDTNGIITLVAGNYFSYGYSGDGGPATNASLNYPGGVALDAVGNLFIADTGNMRIRMVNTNGIITTVAGNGNNGYSNNDDGGPATNASLAAPYGVAVDAAGNLFIADTYNLRIRMVGTNGIITTVAGNGAAVPAISSGTGDSFVYAGDGGPATNASLNRPFDVTVDATGNLFIADTYNYRICQVGTDGIITTVAGKGPGYPVYGSYSGDGGPATDANLYFPRRVAVDAAGNLFIADSHNNRIRTVTNTRGPALALNYVTAANAGNYQVVATGPYGSVTSSVVRLIVTTSPLIYQTVPNSDGSVTLDFVTAPNVSSRVLAATNLTPPVVWQPIYTNVAGPAGAWRFTDTNAGSHPLRFYRSSTP
jgi:sugar lactone lactonase YvrE